MDTISTISVSAVRVVLTDISDQLSDALFKISAAYTDFDEWFIDLRSVDIDMTSGAMRNADVPLEEGRIIRRILLHALAGGHACVLISRA